MVDLFDKCSRFLNDPRAIERADLALAADLFRRVSPPGNAGPMVETDDRPILQFSSNDYLGLAMHPEARTAAVDVVSEHGICSPMGSRLMTGTTADHLRLEETLARFKRCEAAITFTSGALAMIGTLAAMAGSQDLLILDEHAHATLMAGARASGAMLRFFRHNDLEHLEEILEREEVEGGRAIVVDGVYSMHGDVAPLAEMVELKKKFNARLVVDDAHGTGVFGPEGRGAASEQGVEDQIDLHAGTFSKAIGTIGGFVTGDSTAIDYLRFQAPTYVFTKSMPLAVVVATQKTLELLREADDRRERLWSNTRRLQTSLRERGLTVGNTQSPITPVEFSGNEALHTADTLHKQHGIWVAPVVYPAIELGRSILRIIPTANHSDDDIDRLVEALADSYGSMQLGSILPG